LIGSAIELKEALNKTNNTAVKSSDKSPYPSITSTIEITTEKMTKMGMQKTQIKDTVEIYFKDLRDLNSKIGGIYQDAGVPVPKQPDNIIPVINPKP
jgi:glycine/serine hydroxymethyltransferase